MFVTKKVTKYASQKDYCATEEYKSWLAKWEPVDKSIDIWQDTAHDIFSWGNKFTPREYISTRFSSRLIFHLLEQLGVDTVEKKVDIGCGTNWFSKIYPSVWGVDPEYENKRHEKLTPEWWISNWTKWPMAFSINSLHFVDQSQLIRDIEKVGGILSAKGKALITLNRARIKEQTGDGYSENKLLNDLENIQNLDRLIWIETPEDEALDGNVWIFIDKLY